MKHSPLADRLIPTALVALALVPCLAGAFRLAEIGRGATITAANARFVEHPLPVVVHIVSATIFSLLGAFQFAPGFRRRRPSWHRIAGRVSVACGLVVAVTGLWMTWTYPYAPGDGALVWGIREVVGSAMLISIILGLVAVRQRNFAQHSAWMIRGYAIAMGAGTQVFTHVIWSLTLGSQSETDRAIVLGAGWAINIVFAEWAIRRQRRVVVDEVPIRLVIHEHPPHRLQRRL